MLSPFPGMDPSIEGAGLWPDFHQGFINACHQLLNERLPSNYVARMNERVSLVDLSATYPQGAYPDVSVTRRPEVVPLTSNWSLAGTAVLDPVIVPMSRKYFEVVEGFIEIFRLGDVICDDPTLPGFSIAVADVF